MPKECEGWEGCRVTWRVREGRGGGSEGGCNVAGCEGGLLWVASGPAFVTHRAWTVWVATARRVPNACLLLSSALLSPPSDARENLEETARAFGLPTARVRVCVRWRPPALSASPAIRQRLAHPEVVLALSEGAKVRRALVSILYQSSHYSNYLSIYTVRHLCGPTLMLLVISSIYIVCITCDAS